MVKTLPMNIWRRRSQDAFTNPIKRMWPKQLVLIFGFIALIGLRTWSSFQNVQRMFFTWELSLDGSEEKSWQAVVYPSVLTDAANQSALPLGNNHSRPLIEENRGSGERLVGGKVYKGNATKPKVNPVELIQNTDKDRALVKIINLDPDSTHSNLVNISNTSDLFRYFSPPTTENLWNKSTSLPTWLKDYYTWHHQQRLKLNESNWQKKEFRFLIPSAFHGVHSGGTTDRIRPIPAFLRLASQTNRILLLYWERPFPLEEFLLPPLGGMDWRVPEYMRVAVKATKALGSSFEPIEKAARDAQRKIVTTVYASWNYGELWYKEQEQVGEPSLYKIYRDIWQVVFTPSPPVAQKIYHNFETMGLVPGEFATAHIRALYAINDRPKKDIARMARNAMNCTSRLRPSGPFFVASDSLYAIDIAIHYGKKRNVTVVATNYSQQPLHVDFQNEADTNLRPRDFYDGFVDLYLMAATRCAAVGPGGFARWGHLLGYNETCAIHHFGRKSEKCDWQSNVSFSTERPMLGYPSEEERLVLQAKAKRVLPRYHWPIDVTMS